MGKLKVEVTRELIWGVGRIHWGPFRDNPTGLVNMLFDLILLTSRLCFRKFWYLLLF